MLNWLVSTYLLFNQQGIMNAVPSADQQEVISKKHQPPISMAVGVHLPSSFIVWSTIDCCSFARTTIINRASCWSSVGVQFCPGISLRFSWGLPCSCHPKFVRVGTTIFGALYYIHKASHRCHGLSIAQAETSTARENEGWWNRISNSCSQTSSMNPSKLVCCFWCIWFHNPPQRWLQQTCHAAIPNCTGLSMHPPTRTQKTEKNNGCFCCFP